MVVKAMRGPKPPVVELSPGRAARIGKPWCADIAPPSSWPGEAEIISVCRGWPEQQPNSPAKWAWMWITVRFWRNRWLGLQAAILEDLSIEERLRDCALVLGLPPGSPQSKFCQIMSPGL